MKRFVIWLGCLVAGVSFSLSAMADDFSQGVSVSGNLATIWLKSNVNTSWVDAHYQVTGADPQNLRMVYQGGSGRFEQPASVKSGNTISYFFTYTKDGLAHDTPRYNYTVGSSSGGGTTTGAVCFYEHTNYVGASTCSNASSAWVGTDWNDRISSVKVQAGKQVQLFEHSNQGGRSITLTADEPNLVNRNFNDAASSYTIGNAGTGGGGGGGGGSTDYPIYPGFIGVDLKNNTNGAWRDDQVYVAVIGRNPANGQFSYLKPDGSLIQLNVGDNDGPGHLSKGGANYSNYFFTLAQSKLLKLPKMDSGRVFMSVGSPMFIKVLIDGANNVGFAGPNPLNTSDANIDVYYDWYEFTYNNSGLWINTTQVDQFGVPLLLDVWGANRSFHMQTGINDSRASIYQKFASEVPGEFRSSATPYRIMAPAKASFGEGQADAHYFDGYVNQVWDYYRNNTLSIDMWGGSRRFDGRVQGDQLVFTEVNKNNGAYVGGTYTIAGKPTTQDILEGRGRLASGNWVELALEAQVCAAFNRHIMTDVGQWRNPGAWYKAGPANYYAKFWHDHSVGGIAYGFAYDDVSEQSSTIFTPTPEHMAFGIGW